MAGTEIFPSEIPEIPDGSLQINVARTGIIPSEIPEIPDESSQINLARIERSPSEVPVNSGDIFQGDPVRNQTSVSCYNQNCRMLRAKCARMSISFDRTEDHSIGSR